MKILLLYDKSGPKYHRLLLPCYLMQGVELIIKSQLEEKDLEGVDILFFNRMIPNVTINEVEKWRDKYGFALVADFDDHWRLGPDHILYDMYIYYRASELMEAWISTSDAVFVTHERLYADILPLNKNVHILPNAIPEFGQYLTKKIESEYTRLFWAGGITHKRDIELLRQPVKRINRKGVQWVMGGYGNHKEWQAMASSFTNGGQFNNDLINALPVEEYYYTYSKCDISLVPLVSNVFNSYKSNLKILETANIGSPVVVSKVNPYLGFPEDIVNYVEKQSDWYTQVNKLLTNPDLIKEQGERLKAYCKEHYNFEKINTERKQILDATRKQRQVREIPGALQQVG